MQIKRTAGITAAAVAAVGTLVSFGTAPATALSSRPEVQFQVRKASSNRTDIYVSTDGKRVGYAKWVKDSKVDLPDDDTLYAVDEKSDGYYIEASLDDLRIVSTKGYKAPVSRRNGGDLREDEKHRLQVCLKAPGWSFCSLPVQVSS